MNNLERSKKIFVDALMKEPEITREKWDEYAHENYLYSAFTLEAHYLTDMEWEKDTSKFELLKKKLMPLAEKRKKWWY